MTPKSLLRHPKATSRLGELANGAGGPGTRPVITDRRAVRGEALIISIYCPDELPEFTELVEAMVFADVINDR